MGVRKHLLVGRHTRCGIPLERYDDVTWITRAATGSIVMVCETLDGVDCLRCKQFEAAIPTVTHE
jgi:hypothetical protein